MGFASTIGVQRWAFLASTLLRPLWVRKMARAVVLLLLFVPAVASGQTGFPADFFDPSLAKEGLLVIKGPTIEQDRAEVALAIDWPHHLLGIRAPENENIRWVVRDRLSLHLGFGYSPTSFLRLEAGFHGVPYQTGESSDDLGAPTELAAAMGSSWLTANLGIPWLVGSPLEAALATTIVLPTADSSSLTGTGRIELRVEGLLSLRLGPFRPIVNFGVCTSPRIRFRNLVRDDGIIYRAGLEVGQTTWPFAFSFELAGQTLLTSPFSSSVNEWLEAIIGLRIHVAAGTEVQVGAGTGLVGVGAPSVRGVVLMRWSFQVKKGGFTTE